MRQNVYTINKALNFFIFVGELCRVRGNPWNKERVHEWLMKSGGKLSNNERTQIAKFSNVLFDVDFNLIEAYFVTYRGDKLQAALKKSMSTPAVYTIKKIIKNFQQRFDSLWKQEEPRLKKIRKYFISQSRKLGSDLMVINRLAGDDLTASTYNDMPIHLVISSERSRDAVGWFSSLGNRTDLVLECSGTPDKSYNFLNAILLHELFHVVLRKNRKIMNQIAKISRENSKLLGALSRDIKPSLILEELVISSFIPEGFLGTRYTNSSIKRTSSIGERGGLISFVSARKFCAYQLRKIAEEYVKTLRAIDERYLLLVISAIKNR